MAWSTPPIHRIRQATSPLFRRSQWAKMVGGASRTLVLPAGSKFESGSSSRESSMNLTSCILFGDVAGSDLAGDLGSGIRSWASSKKMPTSITPGRIT
jgi:hypothetical protein